LQTHANGTGTAAAKTSAKNGKSIGLPQKADIIDFPA
jgi:hypothetical protein